MLLILQCCHWSADLWSLHHFNLFWMLIVKVRGFLMDRGWGSSMIFGFIELMVNRFGRNCTIQMLIQLCSRFGGSSPMLSSHNALQCTSGRKSGWNYSGCWRFFLAYWTPTWSLICSTRKKQAVQFWWLRLLPYELRQFALFQTQLGHAF